MIKIPYQYQSTLVFLGFALAVVFLIPYTRNEMKALTGAGLGAAGKFLLMFIKHLLDAHWLILRNLVSPRKVIYPTLVSDDQVNRA